MRRIMLTHLGCAVAIAWLPAAFGNSSTNGGGAKWHVVARIENASRHCGRNALIERAFDFVRSHDLTTLPVGRYEIAGEDCYAMVQEQTLKPVAEGRYEFHRDYYDIQLPIDGEEVFGLTETPDSVLAAARWDGKDILFFDAPMKTVTVRPGEFVILPPLRGAHAPCLTTGKPRKVKKLVIKVRAAASVAIAPVVRTRGLAAYSTNRLAFALNNGLGLTAGGRLWASWIAGEDGAGAFTVASYSDDGGETWSDVALAIDGHGDAETDRTNIIGTFWLAPDGKFRLYTDQSSGHFDGRAGIWESVCADPDARVTQWSPMRRLGHGHVLNKPIVLGNGHWAMSGYLNWAKRGAAKGAFAELDGERGATCYVSSDGGATWERRGTAIFPGKDWQESQLVELRDGTLRVFARVKEGDVGKMMAADSKDEGRTWTAPFALASMDNPNARFQVVRLASGRLLFVKQGAPSAGGKDGQGRDMLTAYLSEDDGKTWLGGLRLFEGASSYPDACQGPDGVIYVSHDHERSKKAEIRLHRFSEEDVLARRIVSKRGRLNLLVSKGMGAAAAPANGILK